MNRERMIVTEGSFFSLKGRLNRLEYIKLVFGLFLFGIITFIYFLPGASIQYMKGIIAITVVLLIMFLPITVQRLHDSNHSGGYVLMILISRMFYFGAQQIYLGYLSQPTPISYYILTLCSMALDTYFLYLMLHNGNSFNNNYGEPKEENNYSKKQLIFLITIIIVLIVICGLVRFL